MNCLGLPAPHSTHQALLDRLAEKRPELQNLKTHFINPSYVLTSMRSNKIDSFFWAEPWGTKCIHEKLGQILIRSKDIMPGHTRCILAVREEYALKRSHVVRDYVSLLVKARDRTRKDPSFGAMTQSLFTGVARGTATHVLEQRLVTFDDLKPDKQRVMAITPLFQTNGAGSAASHLDRFVCADFF
ncbi:MAG: ABC transporter substrate-binding protein [Deltaproteobacteria bacterium]